MKKPSLSADEIQQAHNARSALFVKLIEVALYTPITLTGDNSIRQAKELRLHRFKHDMFCPECNLDSTFNSVPTDEDISRAAADAAQHLETLQAALAGRDPAKPYDWSSRFSLRMTCARAGHFADFYFASELHVQRDSVSREMLEIDGKPQWRWVVSKVGQTPSLTDFHRVDVGKFKGTITKAQEADFVRAINTGAHGFNVAACVYYRRVFEGILDSTAAEHAAANEIKLPWDEYESANTLGKVRLLKADLPAFLVENSHLYTLLSKGAHKLTETECGEQLPVIRQAIELILEERVERLNKKRRQEQTAKLLQQANAKHEGK